MVSIITPCHNGSKFISDAIMSVFQQTYHDWELIIVDDCSTDDSLSVIDSLVSNNSRVNVIALDTNVGAAEARNVALRVAQGRYIAFLDSDDVWLPNKLMTQLKYMEDNGYAFTFTSYHLMKEDGKLMNRIIHAPSVLSYSDYLKNTIIGCLTVILDTHQVGKFEMPNIRSSHDMALWLLIMKRGFKAYGLIEDLAHYRIVGNSNTAKKGRAAKDVWAVYRSIEKLSLVYSSYCFVWYTFNAIKKRVL